MSDHDECVPIVCIGCSAGGLTPLEQIFCTLDPSTNMAFVVIHHVRRGPTMLVPILSRWTSMLVLEARDNQRVLPNHVYVLPSGREIELRDGRFKVQPLTKRHGWPNLVSLFIDSLSHGRHPGIAVILSGLDGDGAAALKSLKRHGGTVIVQSPAAALHPDMPRAAIMTGEVDFVLDAFAIGAKLKALPPQRDEQPA